MKKYNVPAIDKAMAILDLLAYSDQEFTVTEIHAKLGIPKGTAFMTLNVLESYDMVRKNESGRYMLGAKVYSLGMAYITKMDIKKLARKFMEQLTQETGFTTHLGILSENRILFVDKVEPQTFIKFSTFPGMKQDIHNSSLGKAIAAYLPEEQLDTILKASGMGQYTPNTITDPHKFKQALAVIRTNGYAVEDEEGEIGVRCVGAPIFDGEGQITAAISVTALKLDLTADLIPAVGKKVMEAAAQVTGCFAYETRKAMPE